MSCSSCATGSNGAGGCKGGCAKLEVTDWLAGVPKPVGQPGCDAVEVRFKSTRKGFYRNVKGLSLMAGDVVTVEAPHGYDVGVVSLAGMLVRAQMKRKGAGTDTYSLRKVLHKSTQQEIDRWQQVREKEDETLFEARAICKQAGLDMKVSDVEYRGDAQRATIYFMADERVDFRHVLRQLSDRFNVRVDMKQIGARQEAARIGGIGPSGRELCCSTWLTDLRSVSTKAARYQQLSLNPEKLTGLCGKLKCCLNYELDMYVEAIKSYPSQKAKLKTKQGVGFHNKTDIFEERMWYLFKQPGQAPVLAGFPVDTVKEILESNKRGEVPDVNLHMAEDHSGAAPEDLSTQYGNVIDDAADLTRFDRKQRTKSKRRKGKRKRAAPGEGGRKEAGKQTEGRAKKRKGRRKQGGGTDKKGGASRKSTGGEGAGPQGQ